MEKQNKIKKINDTSLLGNISTDAALVQFVPVEINFERTEFPPFGRVDTACYPASLLRKAYYLYSLPQVSLTSRPSQLVKYSG
jgi:hypothetical protein